MKILIAIDKFKGSLTSLQAAQAIRNGIEEASASPVIEPAADSSADSLRCNTYEMVEIADGGDGSASVLLSVKEGVEEVKAEGVNPSGQKIESSYLMYYESDSAAGSAVSSADADSADGSAVGSADADPADGSAAVAGALKNGAFKKCAFIEMAKISGLELIPPVDSEGRRLRNPLVTTTYGLGELIRKAYEGGARKITLSIGGSATNDGGTGMLQALGFKFYDKDGSLINDYMCGGLLSRIAKIEAPSSGPFGRACDTVKAESRDEACDETACDQAAGDQTRGKAVGACEIEVICDVTNPLLGATGATYVYGPQKGADPVMLQQLEEGMENFVRVAEGAVAASAAAGERFQTVGAKISDSQASGHALHECALQEHQAHEHTLHERALHEHALREPQVHEHALREHTLREPQVQTHLLPGAGAAGGVGYAVNHFLGGKIISGWRFFANLTNLQQKIAQADLVISGEGRIDSQSLNGKVVDGVITLAKQAGKPVWLFCGLNSLGTDSLGTNSLDTNSLGTNSFSARGQSSQTPAYPIFQLASLEPDRDKSMQNAAPLLERLARQAATSHLNDL